MEYLLKWCIMEYLSNALWDFWDGSLITDDVSIASANSHMYMNVITYPCSQLGADLCQ